MATSVYCSFYNIPPRKLETEDGEPSAKRQKIQPRRGVSMQFSIMDNYSYCIEYLETETGTDERFNKIAYVPRQMIYDLFESIHSKFPHLVEAKHIRNGPAIYFNAVPLQDSSHPLLTEWLSKVEKAKQQPTYSKKYTTKVKLFELLLQRLVEKDEEEKQQKIHFRNKLFHSVKENTYYQRTMSAKFPLPAELLRNMFRYLRIEDLSKLCIVCKEWFYLITSPDKVNPIVTELKFKHLLKRDGEASTTFINLITRFGHNLTMLDAEWCIYINKAAFGEMFTFLNKDLTYLNLDHCKVDESVMHLIGSSFPKLKSISMENCFDHSPGAIFANCRELEEIYFNSDECDIAMECINDVCLSMLAKNTNGSLRVLEFNRCDSDKMSEETLAEVIRKSPQLHTLVFGYDIGSSEAMDRPAEHSVIVKALQEIYNKRNKKPFESLEIGRASKADKIRIKALM